MLELPAVIDLLHRYLSGPISEPLLEGASPHTNLEKIRRDLELAGEAREYLRVGARPSLAGLCNPGPLLEKLRVEGLALAALENAALWNWRGRGWTFTARSRGWATRSGKHADWGEGDGGPSGALRAGSWEPQLEGGRTGAARRHGAAYRAWGTRVRPVLASRRPCRAFAELARTLADFRSLVMELGGNINADGTVDSSASPELGRIRRAIDRAKLEIQSSLERMLRRYSQDNVVQDEVVTIRNDRFVIPVRVEEKRRVQGVVHGSSSSGATVYIEPLETLSLNNELVELQDREFAEVQRILGEFTRKLRERREDLTRAADILGEIDWAFAKGEFSRQFELHPEDSRNGQFV